MKTVSSLSLSNKVTIWDAIIYDRSINSCLKRHFITEVKRTSSICKGSMSKKKDVVVVTGANGFLGQHVIKLLHTYCTDEVEEIRIFDIKPFSKRLGKFKHLRIVLTNIYCIAFY